VPKGFSTEELQWGSFYHSPSTENRYSYCPGFRASEILQILLSSIFRGCEVGFHGLKSPARDTLCAWGADKLTSVFLTFSVALGFFLDFVTITYLLFVLNCPFHPESIHVEVPKKTSNQNPYTDKPYESVDQRLILSS
jgi:hypothetical protein